MDKDDAEPLVVIGHSHTETVAAAARSAGVALDSLNFWHWPDPFVDGATPLRLVPKLAARLVSPVFSMVGGAVHQDVGLVVHPRAFDFVWPSNPDLPLAPEAEIIPFDAVHESLRARTQYFLDIMGAVRAAADGAVFHLESPPTYRDEELPRNDPYFYHLFGADARFSPAWLRYKLWRVHSGIVAEYCSANGIVFLPHPPDALTEEGFLRPELHGTPAHANAAYGALLLAQMQRAAAAAGGRRPAPPSRSDAPAAEIEGEVDGWRGGAIVGWACWPRGSRNSGETVLVEAVLDEAVVGHASADNPRPDVAATGRAANCGFAIRLDPAVGAGKQGGSIHVRARNGGRLAGAALSLRDGTLSAGDDVVQCRPPPPWRLQRSGLTGYIDTFGPDRIEGWAQHVAHASAPVVFGLWEDECEVATLTANQWRIDVAAMRGGDGRWGLEAPVPDALRDGKVHRLELRLRDGRPVLDEPVLAQFAQPDETSTPLQAKAPETQRYRPRPPRTDTPDDMMFSIVVNFYNMPREAARTLASLARSYQRGIGHLRYEVLCIDNGSDPPMRQDQVEVHGPEFRLIRPSKILPSCCHAINEAVSEAHGRHIAIMIDGAHVLTPGALREAWDALSEAPGAVVALRPWFVGGDQRWLAEAGYTRAHEDMLFDRIAWPSDGYRLFEIGEAFWESSRPWFDGMIESNCLFLPRALYRAIGGMDEGFSEPGAGYANLDLFRRATNASDEPLVALIGEATFHQFHDGTTTNAVTATKEARVRGYESRYIALRGEPYPVLDPARIRVRGQVRTLDAVASRQRPASPAGIGVTDRIRQGSVPHHFDLVSQQYMQSAYVECGLQERAFWLGQPLGMAPSDALTIQDLIVRLRPGRIVAVNVRPGVIALLDSVLRIADLPASRIVAVSADKAPASSPRSVRPIQGDPTDADTLAQVVRALDSEEHVMVLFCPDTDDRLPIEALRHYAGLVTCRSYLVVLGTALGQPWLGYSRRFTLAAVRMLTDTLAFTVDQSCNPHWVTTSPLGYLQRIEAPGRPVDPVGPDEG